MEYLSDLHIKMRELQIKVFEDNSTPFDKKVSDLRIEFVRMLENAKEDFKAPEEVKEFATKLLEKIEKNPKMDFDAIADEVGKKANYYEMLDCVAKSELATKIYSNEKTEEGNKISLTEYEEISGWLDLAKSAAKFAGENLTYDTIDNLEGEQDLVNIKIFSEIKINGDDKVEIGLQKSIPMIFSDDLVKKLAQEQKSGKN